jgi:3-deoxy-D-manno-octulosonate 8-phosphate phosphatase (KDO 8-P phosphatase)
MIERGLGTPRDSTPLERARPIRLIMMDVDGVLTDGRILYTDEGVEIEAFSVKDGFGLRAAQRAGLLIAVVTGRASEAVARRVRELGVHEYHEGVRDKLEIYEAVLRRHRLTDDAVAYLGDDLNDLPLLARAGLSAAPADAADEVKACVTYVASRGGGRGAVREVIDVILKAQGRWAEAVRDLSVLPEGETLA